MSLRVPVRKQRVRRSARACVLVVVCRRSEKGAGRVGRQTMAKRKKSRAQCRTCTKGGKFSKRGRYYRCKKGGKWTKPRKRSKR
jgi:hypothetical protein